MHIKALLALSFGTAFVCALPTSGAGRLTRDLHTNVNPILESRSSGGQHFHIHEDNTATGPNPPGSGGSTGIKLEPQSATGARIQDQMRNVLAGENYEFSGTGGGRENTPPPEPVQGHAQGQQGQDD